MWGSPIQAQFAWALTNVSQEVARLKHHNSQLESLLEEAGVAQQALEQELESARQHCQAVFHSGEKAKP